MLREMLRLSPALLLVLSLFTGCSKGSDEPTPQVPPSGKDQLTLTGSSASGITFSSDGGSGEITFTSTSSWAASVPENAASWCSLGKTSGQGGTVSLPVTVAANGTYDERNATVTITSGTLKRTVVITQKQLDALLLSSSKVEIPGEGGEFTAEVKSNISYTATVPPQFASWISKTPSGRGLTTSSVSFTVSPGIETPREGYVVFQGNGLEERLNVYQHGSIVLILTEKTKNMPAEGGSFSVELKSNCEYTIGTPTASWLRLDASRSVSSHTIYFTVDPYDGVDAPRSAEVTFTSTDGKIKETLTVIQHEKAVFILAPAEYDVPPQGKTFKVEYSTNSEVGCEISPEGMYWITAYDTEPASRAVTTGEKWFTVQPNSIPSPRSASVRLYSVSDPSQSGTITFKQSAIEVEVESDVPSGLFTDARSHILNVTVKANVPYTIKLPENITEVTSADAPAGTHRFKIAPNHQDKNMDSEIKFLVNGRFITSLYIQQVPAYVNLLRNNAAAPPNGGDLELSIDTNTDIETEVVCDTGSWITLIDRSEDNLMPLLRIAPNESSDSRQATIRLKAGSFFNADYIITQIGQAPATSDVNVDIGAGGLEDALGPEAHEIESIDVNGTINAADINTLIDLVKNGNLRTIDLSGASIKGGPGVYYTAMEGTYKAELPEDNMIGDYMFQDVKAEHIILPATLKKIGYNAFCNSGLTEMTIPEGVTDIGREAFKSCGHLTSVTIPSTVDSLAYGTFFSCLNLSNVNLSDGLKSIGELVFGNLNVSYTTPVQPLSSIRLPNTLTKIGNMAFRGCGITEIEIPASVTDFGESIFDTCLQLRKVTIKSAPADGRLPDDIFYLNTKLTELSLPEGITTLGVRSLAHVGVINLQLPSTLKVMERAALSQADCNTVSLPEGLTTIGEGAMAQLPWLTRLDLPSTVTQIESGAFTSTYYSIKEIHCRMATPPALSDAIFSNKLSRDIPFYVPAGSAALYRSAPFWSEFTNIIEE